MEFDPYSYESIVSKLPGLTKLCAEDETCSNEFRQFGNTDFYLHMENQLDMYVVLEKKGDSYQPIFMTSQVEGLPHVQELFDALYVGILIGAQMSCQ